MDMVGWCSRDDVRYGELVGVRIKFMLYYVTIRAGKNAKRLQRIL